jgi:type IV pilus assembly protein PilW
MVPVTAARRPCQRRGVTSGFSLIELLLALALGLVAVTGVVQLFVSNSRTYDVSTGQARLQENARFALDFVARAARSSGYLGCTREPDALVRGLLANWELLPEVDITHPVYGYPAANVSALVPRSSAGTDTNVFFRGAGIDTDAIAPGTDVVVFRALRAPGMRLAEILQPDGTPLVHAPSGGETISANDVIGITNCEQGVVARVSGVVPTGAMLRLELATGPVVADRAAPTSARYRNAFDSLSAVGKAYGLDTVVAQVESTYFYIAPGLGRANTGAAPLSLWQKVGFAEPVELVQGIEDLEARFGIDRVADGVPGAVRYVTTAELEAADADHIVAVRVTLTANSVDGVDGGEQLRRAFTRTIQIRNARHPS